MHISGGGLTERMRHVRDAMRHVSLIELVCVWGSQSVPSSWWRGMVSSMVRSASSSL